MISKSERSVKIFRKFSALDSKQLKALWNMSGSKNNVDSILVTADFDGNTVLTIAQKDLEKLQ